MCTCNTVFVFNTWAWPLVLSTNCFLSSIQKVCDSKLTVSDEENQIHQKGLKVLTFGQVKCELNCCKESSTIWMTNEWRMITYSNVKVFFNTYLSTYTTGKHLQNGGLDFVLVPCIHLLALVWNIQDKPYWDY